MTNNKNEWLGSFNDAPPNFKEITDKEFARIFSLYSMGRKEYKQILTDRNNLACLSIDLFVNDHDKTGVGIATNYYGFKNSDGSPSNQHVKFYYFAQCEHEYTRTKNLGKCYNEYTCKKCGLIKNVDSSD